MQNLKNKIIVTFVSSIILLTGLSTVTAESFQKESIATSEVNVEPKTKTVTVFRYGLDGSVEPVEIEIDLSDGENLDDLIEEKCLELLKNDIEFQSILNENISTKVLTLIRSRGRGLHIKLSPRIQLIKRINVFPLLPPYFRTGLLVPIVFCKYKGDLKAFTQTTPIIDTKNATTERVEGPHTVLAIGFWGFTWWIGHFSYSPILRRGFVGISLLTRTKLI